MIGNMHRTACADLHVILAWELKDYCWNMLADCIVIERAHLLDRLSIDRIKKVRMAWFQVDVSPWFPCFRHTETSGKDEHVHSCYLSRFPFPEGVMTGAMAAQHRQLRLCEAGLKTITWSPEL